MPDTDMTAADFSAALAKLGLEDDATAGAALGSDERTVRRWRNGERGVPGPAATLVRLWLTIQAKRSLLPAERAKFLPAGAADKPVAARAS